MKDYLTDMAAAINAAAEGELRGSRSRPPSTENRSHAASGTRTLFVGTTWTREAARAATQSSR
jgi:hypothetical protein